MRTQTYKMIMGICLVVAFSVWMGGQAYAQASDMKIGWVDLQRVINASEEGKKAQDDMKKKADELEQKAQKMQGDIDAMKADLEKQAGVLNAQAQDEKRDTISKAAVEYDRFVKDSRTELQTIEQRALKQLLADVGKLVVDYGKQNGFAVIMEAGNILYGAENIDLTDKIIEAYNTARKK